MEQECKKWALEYKGKNPLLKVNTGYRKEESKLEMSPEEHYISIHGDHGQAERLVNAKRSNQSSPNTPVITSKSPAVASRAQSYTPNSPPKAKVQNSNIFAKNASRNITPGSSRANYSRKSPMLK